MKIKITRKGMKIYTGKKDNTLTWQTKIKNKKLTKKDIEWLFDKMAKGVSK